MELGNHWYRSSVEDIRKALHDIRTLGYQNPINPDEYIINDNVLVSINRFDDNLWLSHIESVERGQGNASKVLKQICDIADRYNVYMSLEPSPYGKNGLNKNQLVTWYKKFGFKKYDGNIYQRTPKKLKEHNMETIKLKTLITESRESSVRMICMSHISDVQDGALTSREGIKTTLNFVKYLLLKYSNTNKQIDPEVEYNNFKKKYNIEDS